MPGQVVTVGGGVGNLIPDTILSLKVKFRAVHSSLNQAQLFGTGLEDDMDTPSPKTCGLYLRVSSGSRQFTDNQRPDLVQLAKSRGYEIVDTYEEGVSATAKNRKEWQRLRLDAHRGKLNVICIAAIDRLGRSMFGNLQEILEMDRIGCSVVSIREPWLQMDGPFRNLLIAILSWVAEEEVRQRSARCRAGVARARAAGKRIGRPPVKVDIDNALDLVHRQGLSIRAAARKLSVGASTLHRLLKAQEALEAAAPKPSSETADPAPKFLGKTTRPMQPDHCP